MEELLKNLRLLLKAFNDYAPKTNEGDLEEPYGVWAQKVRKAIKRAEFWELNSGRVKEGSN